MSHMASSDADTKSEINLVTRKESLVSRWKDFPYKPYTDDELHHMPVDERTFATQARVGSIVNKTIMDPVWAERKAAVALKKPDEYELVAGDMPVPELEAADIIDAKLLAYVIARRQMYSSLIAKQYVNDKGYSKDEINEMRCNNAILALTGEATQQSSNETLNKIVAEMATDYKNKLIDAPGYNAVEKAAFVGYLDKLVEDIKLRYP